MIVGFISDAHGNPVGLERCLEELDNAKSRRIYFLGDSIGYMPDGAAVLDRLNAIGALCIRGNHEEMLLGNIEFTDAQDAVYRLREARTRLESRWKDWINEWPIRREIVVDGLRVLLVHGSPQEPTTGYVYPDTDLTVFQHLPYDFVFFGHTHRPFIRESGATTFVNVGSCGLPRDVGHLASCAILDTSLRSARLLQVELDTDALLAKFGDRVDEAVRACLQRRAVNSDRTFS